MGLDDGFDEAEAQAQAALGAAGIAAEQAIEDARKLVGGNSRPGVAHLQHSRVGGATNFDVHAPASRCVFHGVVNEVRGHLFEAHGVRHDDAQGLGAAVARPDPPIERELALVYRTGPLSPAAARFTELATATQKPAKQAH